MPEHAMDSVVIDAEFENYDAPGSTQFEDVTFLAVTLLNGEQHIWFDDTHYVTTGTAEAVKEGGLFYFSLPEKILWKVANVDDTAPPEDALVEMEILYPPGPPHTDEVQLLSITGIPPRQRPMADPGPPVLLEERPLS